MLEHDGPGARPRLRGAGFHDLALDADRVAGEHRLRELPTGQSELRGDRAERELVQRERTTSAIVNMLFTSGLPNSLHTNRNDNSSITDHDLWRAATKPNWESL